MSHPALRTLRLTLCIAAALLPFMNAEEEVPAPGAAVESMVAQENLDVATYAEWVDGHEKVIQGEGEGSGPGGIVWTDKSHSGWMGVGYGKSDQPGIRHLRIGFLSPIPVGTVLVRGGGRLSVLRPDAGYPGKLDDDDQWISAQRLVDGKVSSAEPGPTQTVAWVLPPGTNSQALRFTHEAAASDPKYEGQIGGVFIIAERFENVAPLATVFSLSNNKNAPKLNNETADGWEAWDNMDPSVQPDAAPQVTPQRPEWILLSWREPVSLRALVALSAGFGSVDLQVFNGAPTARPRDAAESDWKTLAEYAKVQNGYPIQLWPNWLAFPKEVTTRAVRVRITEVHDSKVHPHIEGKMLDGRRVWLDELMALSPLGEKPLQDAAAVAASAGDLKPPIPVRFTLKEPGFVTLVIEKPDGERVRNLISETHFEAGDNVVWWDGTDDLGRDPDAAGHGVYHIPSRLVQPGDYRVRGLTRGEIVPHFEFSVYNAGKVAWVTPDKTGAWLSNHSAPQAAAFIPGSRNSTGKPQIFLGSYISEGRDGLIWTDLEGHKQGGKTWVGGNWTGAPFIAFDAGPEALRDHQVYVGSVWATATNPDQAELRLTALADGEDVPILRSEFAARDPKKMIDEIAGIAAYNGLIVVSLPQQKKLLIADARNGTIVGTVPVEDTRGVAFDVQGCLYVVAGSKVLRYPAIKDPAQMPAPEVIIPGDLENPQQIMLDSAMNIYVSDWGNSHQVKIFAPQSATADKYVPLRAIGNAGAPKAGPYDPMHMNHPYGLAMDSEDHLWVAENDYLPKRVSVWTTDGKLVRAFYGPSKYGGGGAVDPKDKTRFYYGEESHGAMEFKLDWDRGTSELANILYRPDTSDPKNPFAVAAPEVAIYRDGQRYFTNCYNSSPVGGAGNAFIFQDRDGVVRPVAAMGRANDWDVLKDVEFRTLWPDDVNPESKDYWHNLAYFLWSDANDDGDVQPAEVVIRKGNGSGVTVMPDLSFCVALQDGKSVRYAPTGFSAAGVPKYELDNPQVLADGVMDPASSGGAQALHAADGSTVVTLGIVPFAQQSLSGAKNGVAKWSYPSVWPGLHASHEAPPPDRPGELIGTTRLLGGFFEPKGSDAGPLWAVNSNFGMVYIFTADGLFVTTVFMDGRQGNQWSMPAAIRGMSLEGVTLNEENFWPTISGSSDGNIYIVDGGRSSIVSLAGMETIKRLPDSSLPVTSADLAKAQEYQTQAEITRQREQGANTLEVAILPKKPLVDGKMDDWKSAWADIDKRGVKANFNSNSKPYDVTGSVAVSGDRLYAAYRTGSPNLLENSGETPMALFKTGGALDLMISANPSADPLRKAPVPGDMRLIVSLVDKKPRAVLYRAVVPNTPNSAKVPFSSPWKTITFDQVKDISPFLEFAGKDGDFEISVPLTMLGIRPAPGLKVKGDIGILRGNGAQTTARVYWSNKATGITADVPSEAALAPGLWGTFDFQPPKPQ